ncbi:hypothetical protein OAY83_01220, partial [Candidatus Marinimicrobia bacterium]|nr:hypothetical protein [Candidatus Neomarinimicrobiota bacterium]
MFKIIKITIILSFSLCWELTLYINDIEDVAADDYLILGTCESCHDGFHYGEDGYDIPTGVTPYTDIQFFNIDWIGTVDTNGNQCESPEFAVDLRSIRPPQDLVTWNIRGATVGHNSNLELTWNMDFLDSDYELFLYIGNTGYDLKSLDSVEISSQDLNPIYEFINGEWTSYDNIKILMGACAPTGTTTYYIDNDNDGWGTGIGTDYCPGFEPNNFVSNNLDINDSIQCFENQFDDCDVCNGNNLNKDCEGVCFGNAIIDDCDVCNGNNFSCLDEIFSEMPYNVYALIQENFVQLSWAYDNNINESNIVGFNIYHGFDEDSISFLSNQTNNGYTTYDFLTGIFCVSTYDRFNNESDLVCTYASEYFSYFYDLHEGANLISFPYLPENTEIGYILNDITYAIDGVISDGSAAYFYQNIEQWVGSLDNLDYESGYWIKINPDLNQPSIILNVQGFPSQQDTIIYNLNEGYNLISYNGLDNLAIENTIPPELSQYITSIIGEGVATIYNSQLNQWLGNLNELRFGKGYWIETNADIQFYWMSSDANNFILE